MITTATTLDEMLTLCSEITKLRREQAADDWAIRELFKLPHDGDLVHHLMEWCEERDIGDIRLQNAVHNVMAEPLYQNGKSHHGVAISFLMRLSLLAHEAKLPGYHKDNPGVQEAIKALGDPAHPNTTEHVGAPRYMWPCEAIEALQEDDDGDPAPSSAKGNEHGNS